MFDDLTPISSTSIGDTDVGDQFKLQQETKLNWLPTNNSNIFDIDDILDGKDVDVCAGVRVGIREDCGTNKKVLNH